MVSAWISYSLLTHYASVDIDQDDVRGGNWAGFDWSLWRSLNPEDDDLEEVPRTSGLYRVRHTGRQGLEYVGQTGRKLRERLHQLSRKTFQEDQPGDAPHTAAPALWKLQRNTTGELQVSYTNPNIARSEIDRRGIEHALIALHIKTLGVSPTVNLDRSHILQSVEERRTIHPILQNLQWQQDDVVSNTWLGLEWSSQHPLEERLSVGAKSGAYRIWFPEYAPPLAYIGKSTNLTNRLREHEKKFGSEARISTVSLERSLRSVEEALIGAHYLATNTLPKGQQGRRNAFEMEFRQ